LHQSLAALLLAVCPSWLRDHQALPGSGRKIVATHNQKISARGAFADQRKHHPTDIELQLRNFARGVLECSAPADKFMKAPVVRLRAAVLVGRLPAPDWSAQRQRRGPEIFSRDFRLVPVPAQRASAYSPASPARPSSLISAERVDIAFLCQRRR
jgi:hypothetical protein